MEKLMRVFPSWFSWKDLSVVIAVAGIAVFLLFGLLQRDKLTGSLPFSGEIDNPLVIRLVALSVVFSLPVISSCFLFCYFMIRSRRWTPKEVLILLFPLILFLLVLYLPFSHYYERSLAPREPFHAHLHLFPPPITQFQEPSISIVFLGGSTTGWGGWTDVVQEKLQKAFPEQKIQVVNQGVQWYTTLQSLINYETNVRRTKPDIVVIMHAINDLAANADHSYYVSGPFRADYGHLYAALSRLARIRSIFDVTRDVIAHLFYWREREVINVEDFPGLDAFIGYYSRLVQLARLDGSEAVIMTQPYLYKPAMSEDELSALYIDKFNGAGPNSRWSITTARSGMDQYVGSVRKLALDEEVTLIDLERRMPKTLEYLYDDCHYTEDGAKLVADIVSRGLEPVVRHVIESGE